jgi:hypothetical protein
MTVASDELTIVQFFNDKQGSCDQHHQQTGLLCDNVCQLLATGRWFSSGTPVSSSKNTDSHDITEILLKVALNSINQTGFFFFNISSRVRVKHN